MHQHYDASSNKKEVLKAIDAFAHGQQEKNALLVMLHKQNSLPMVISQISVFGVIAILSLSFFPVPLRFRESGKSNLGAKKVLSYDDDL